MPLPMKNFVLLLAALSACSRAPLPTAGAGADSGGETTAGTTPGPVEVPEALDRTTTTRASGPSSPVRQLERLPVERVANTNELLGAVESGVRLELASGRYDLTGRAALLQGLANLVLEGPSEEGAEPAVLWASSCDGPLLTLADCENVELRRLTLVRENTDTACEYPLLAARSGYRLTLQDCVLIGGSTAVSVTGYNAFFLAGGTVRGCGRALAVLNSKHLGLEGTDFRENTGASLFVFRGRDTRHISFSACAIADNTLAGAGTIFDLDASSLPIDLIDCVVKGNTAAGLVGGPGARRLTLSGCRVQEF